MVTDAPTTAEVMALMDRVQAEVDAEFAPDDAGLELHADPVLAASADLYRRLKESMRRVMLEGADALDSATHYVVERWEHHRRILGARAADLADAFRRKLRRLLRATLELLAGTVPERIERDGPCQLERISFTMALAVAPSISFGIHEVLRVVATGGVEMSLSYTTVAGG